MVTVKMKSKLPRHVTIIYNAPSDKNPYPLAPVTDDDTAGTPKHIQKALSRQGISTKLLAIDIPADLKKIRSANTDLIFNCVDDDIGSKPGTAHLAPKAAQELRLPFTGGTAGNILLTTNKAATKQYLLTYGIPTPAFAVVERPEYLDIAYHLRDSFPLMVKPAATDGSAGISQKSIVTNEKNLKKQVAQMLRIFNQPALVEEYIASREINVAILERNSRPFLLPFSEITFERGYGQKYKIVDFAAKWRPKTRQYQHTPAVCPAEISKPLARKLTAYAKMIWKYLNLQSYARIDFRIDERGNPYVLEVNCNPDITNDANTGFPRSCRAAGYNYDEMVVALVEAAWRRYR